MGRKTLPTDEFNLTEREHKVLDFMKKTAAEKGYPPTVREICEELRVKMDLYHSQRSRLP